MECVKEFGSFWQLQLVIETVLFPKDLVWSQFLKVEFVTRTVSVNVFP